MRGRRSAGGGGRGVGAEEWVILDWRVVVVSGVVVVAYERSPGGEGERVERCGWADALALVAVRWGLPLAVVDVAGLPIVPGPFRGLLGRGQSGGHSSGVQSHCAEHQRCPRGDGCPTHLDRLSVGSRRCRWGGRKVRAQSDGATYVASCQIGAYVAVFELVLSTAGLRISCGGSRRRQHEGVVIPLGVSFPRI